MLLPADRSPALQDALHIAHVLHDAGHVALLAGGCVRDLLLGLEPKDYDVATDAPPQRVRQLFKRTQAVGAAFGVVLVHGDSGPTEVATFRTDGEYTDGRRPDAVQFTTADEDAKRRDFTINGLFYDIQTNAVVDYVDGQRDLEARVLRAIGAPTHRFEEDQLRLLRAVRFAARYDFAIEAQTKSAIIKLAPKLARISPERIADELRRMLIAPSRVGAVSLLWQLELMPVLMRSLPTLSVPSMHRAAHARPENATALPVILAALALDWLAGSLPLSLELLSAKRVKAIEAMYRQVLRLSNDELAAISGTLGVLPLLESSPSVATLRRFIARPHYLESRELLATLHRAGDFADRIATVEADLDAWHARGSTPTPWVSGDDLTAAGYSPGPAFKAALDAAYDAQLESRAADKREAMTIAIEHLTRPTL